MRFSISILMFYFRYPSVQRIFPNLSNKIDEFTGRVGKISDVDRENRESAEWTGEYTEEEQETRETFMKRFTGQEKQTNLNPAEENMKRLSTRK